MLECRCIRYHFGYGCWQAGNLETGDGRICDGNTRGEHDAITAANLHLAGPDDSCMLTGAKPTDANTHFFERTASFCTASDGSFRTSHGRHAAGARQP